jgi:hypothetical protein
MEKHMSLGTTLTEYLQIKCRSTFNTTKNLSNSFAEQSIQYSKFGSLDIAYQPTFLQDARGRSGT